MSKIKDAARKPARNTTSVHTSGDSSEECETCSFRYVGFCGAVLSPHSDETRHRETHGTIRARRHLFRPGDTRSWIVVLREGWAIRSVVTPSGKHQIVSILVPGDVAGGEILIREQARIPVQALTPVRYCAFEIGKLKSIAKSDPDLIWTFLDICFSEREASEKRLVDLGRRNAEQRIASLVLDIHERLTKRGLADGTAFPFPLRQQTIADALGLTQVHVSRIITAMRNDGIIQLSGGRLTVLDMQALRDIA